jgi:hypothetical protein
MNDEAARDYLIRGACPRVLNGHFTVVRPGNIFKKLDLRGVFNLSYDVNVFFENSSWPCS